ncbi:MAG: hypothetical protein AAFQ43_06835 [Bacteroidota bacterium]
MTLALLASLSLLASGGAVSDSLPDPRPVVLTGAEVPALLGAAPEAVRAFALREGQATSIPVQVDERFEYDIAVVYADLDPRDCARPSWCRDVTGQVVEVGYADPDTQVGPDPDATLDADDEIALMAADFGPRLTNLSVSAVEVSVASGGETRYAYLLADPEAVHVAERVYVDYTPRFERGDYLATYDRTGSPPPVLMNWLYGYPSRQRPGNNPETTTVSTEHYTAGFSDRWILDRLTIGGGPDLLDVDMVAFGPGVCQRTPHTASLSEGGFLVNRSGPVRAIRRVIGFNSGPLAELQWTFYARYAESRAALRVHPVPGVMSFLDLTPEAYGAIYRSSAHPLGVVVDGQRDPFLTHGEPDWETLTGEAGSYAVRHHTEASGFDRELEVTTTYRDEATPSVQACMFDDRYVAAHGIRVRSKIPNTDPRRGEHGRISLRREFVFGGDPEASLDALREPLAVTVR